MSTCPHCNGPIKESEAYDACQRCGKVINMGQLVSDVQFETTSGGGSRATGQFISSLSSQRDYSGGGRLSSAGRDSRANTEEKGRQLILQYAATLNLQRNHIDAARLLFQTVVQQNFIQGRRTNLVAAACLYIACRRDSSAPMMLIDFSEILQTNVYVLGQTVMSVRSKLATELPVIDPVHYIDRFAARLSLGAKTQQVCNTALQVVRRLSRDWLQTGRRPSGITGVALYIAAHMHGLNPSMADLVKEMHVCDSTLRKRLSEFLDTPAAELPRTDFEGLAEQEFDNVLPPVMKTPRAGVKGGEFDDASIVALDASDNDNDNDNGNNENDDDDDDLDRDDKIDGKKRAVSSAARETPKRRRLRKRSPSPDLLAGVTVGGKSEPESSGDESDVSDDADVPARKRKRRAARARNNARLGDAAASAAVALPPATVDSAELGQVLRLPIEDVRRELTRRGKESLPQEDADVRQALFADNVDRQSLLTSLTVADLRALAENRGGSNSLAAAATTINAADEKPATTLSRGEQRRLLDAAQRTLRETIQRDLLELHQTRKETKEREEQEAQKIADERRLQVVQREAAMTTVAATNSKVRGGGIGRAPQAADASAAAAAAATTAAASTTVVDTEEHVVEAIEGDDVDSEEINGYLLTPAEVRLRSVIWHELNKEYLDEQRAKQESEDQLRAQGKQPRKRGSKRVASSASEAAIEALGKQATKINFAFLETLLNPNIVKSKK